MPSMIDSWRGRAPSPLSGVLVAGATIGSLSMPTAMGSSGGRWDLAGLALASACLLALLIRARGGVRPPITLVVVPMALLMAVAVIRPPDDVADLWMYRSQGRVVAVHHQNPYRVSPATFPDDPTLEKTVRGRWHEAHSFYGPGMVTLAASTALVTGTNDLAHRIVWQSMCAGAVAVAAWLVWRRTRRSDAVACIGLNPLVISSVVHEAHIDALIAVCILAGALLVERRRFVAGVAMLTLGALFKVPLALVPAAALVVIARRNGWRAAIPAGLVSAVLFLAPMAAYGGRVVLEAVEKTSHWFGATSPWIVMTRPRFVLERRIDDFPGLTPDSLLPTVALAVMVLLVAAIALRHSHPRLRPSVGDIDPAATAIVLVTAVPLLLLPKPTFWALGSLAVVVALIAGSRVGILAVAATLAAALAMGIITLVRHIVFGFFAGEGPPRETLVAWLEWAGPGAAIAALVLAWATLGFAVWDVGRKDRPADAERPLAPLSPRGESNS